MAYLAQKSNEMKHAQSRSSERVTHLCKIFHPKRKVKTYLDVGCGNAEITSQIANTFKIEKIYGADVYSPEEYKNIKTDPFIEYHQIIDNKINLPDHSVDLITCFMSIHHFIDFDKMMTEIHRVLKPRGWLFFREHNVPKEASKLRTQLDELHIKFPDHPGGIINYWERHELKTALENKHGFKHLANSDYPKNINNPKAIYHSLYLKM